MREKSLNFLHCEFLSTCSFLEIFFVGTYECLATTDYCREGKPPKVPAVLFAIDVSYPMMKEGIVQLICSNMKEILKHLPRDMNCDKVSL